MIEGKKILIFGGSGSLGNKLIQRYLDKNEITNYSRDECKHWKMSLKYKSDRLNFIIGDIRDLDRVQTSIVRIKPDIIIIAAALKHIDRCEFAVEECNLTNFVGPLNVLNSVEKHVDVLCNLKCVVFVSTDKACEPTNVYGMTKALSESSIVEKSLYIKSVKFVNVRYGNVLNSRGSIIPILHEKGRDPEVTHFTLTDPEMSRFVMTLEDSVDLIEHAILVAESGDTVIPTLISMKVKDMLELFSEKYGKPIKTVGIRPGEKMLESLVSETQSSRLVKGDKYMYIKPSYFNKSFNDKLMNYNSSLNPLSKQDLKEYLVKLELL